MNFLFVFFLLQMCVVSVTLPEWEDNEAGYDKNCSKHDEDVVAGVPPPSIVEHLSRLSVKERVYNQKMLFTLDESLPNYSSLL